MSLRQLNSVGWFPRQLKGRRDGRHFSRCLGLSSRQCLHLYWDWWLFHLMIPTIWRIWIQWCLDSERSFECKNLTSLISSASIPGNCSLYIESSREFVWICVEFLYPAVSGNNSIFCSWQLIDVANYLQPLATNCRKNQSGWECFWRLFPTGEESSLMMRSLQ